MNHRVTSSISSILVVTLCVLNKALYLSADDRDASDVAEEGGGCFLQVLLEVLRGHLHFVVDAAPRPVDGQTRGALVAEEIRIK